MQRSIAKWNKFSRIEKLLIGILIWVMITTLTLWSKKDDKDVSSFANMFNGYLSPFVSLIAAFLVYISFREQIKANRMLQAQWSFDIYLRMFNDIKDSIAKISIVDSTVDLLTQYKGVGAFQKISNISSHTTISGVFGAFRDLEPLMKEFLRLINKLRSEDIREDYLEYKVYMYYQSDIRSIIQFTNTYFEKNPSRIKTKEANTILLSVMKQIEEKMQPLREKFGKDMTQEDNFNS